MWLSYWKLARDPFTSPGAPYVSVQTHDEAVARLVHAIETRQRSASLRAAPGLGKSYVLAEALAQTRSPWRRLARAVSPIDGASLFATLAEGLGARVDAGASRATAWRALVQAVELQRWQRTHVVLAVDDAHLVDAASECERLLHLDPSPGARLTVLRVGRTAVERDAHQAPWEVIVRLAPLTRDEAARFVLGKLASVGRSEPTFAPRALSRLHAASEGVPRGLDRLSALALMAGAVGGLEIITPDVIDGVAGECVLPAA